VPLDRPNGCRGILAEAAIDPARADIKPGIGELLLQLAHGGTGADLPSSAPERHLPALRCLPDISRRNR
jgi:hypothetical protein